MKHIEYYVADDGTRFDDEYACEVYEELKRMGVVDISKHLKIFDNDKTPIEVGAFNEEEWQNLCWYFIVYDDIGYEYMDKCEEWTGICLPRKPLDVEYPMVLEYSEWCADDTNCVDLKKKYEEAKEHYDLIAKYI